MKALESTLLNFRERNAKVLRESKFKEHGKITPEEFVIAGDFLTYKFPLWSWQKGDAKPREHLPTDKQYLLLQGAPCPRRATSLAYTDAEEDSEKLLSMGGDTSKEDDWVQTHAGRVPPKSDPDTIEDIPDDEAVTADMQNMNLKGNEMPADDEIPDMEEDDLEDAMNSNIIAFKQPAPTNAGGSNIQKTRKYDAMITYDKYYSTPRVWLLGYDEDGTPLKPQQIFEDVSADHANKTVTIEPFPHSTSLTLASVHPCRHSSVMKKVIERMNEGMIEEHRKAIGGPGSGGTPQPVSSSNSSASSKRWLGGAIRRVTGGGTPTAEKSPVAEDEDDGGMKVDWYLVVFLKFLSSIVPTIELDSTSSM